MVDSCEPALPGPGVLAFAPHHLAAVDRSFQGHTVLGG